MAYRPRADLPRLGETPPVGPLLLDTNVFVNMLAGREPPALSAVLQNLSTTFVSGPTRAELAWVRGRLDPDHAGTAIVVRKVNGLLARIQPSHVLTPNDKDWLAAGELAGRVARMIGGGGRNLATAFDRTELISDALTAILARQAELTIITEDADFDVLMRQLPGLQVLFYDRPARHA